MPEPVLGQEPEPFLNFGSFIKQSMMAINYLTEQINNLYIAIGGLQTSILENHTAVFDAITKYRASGKELDFSEEMLLRFIEDSLVKESDIATNQEKIFRKIQEELEEKRKIMDAKKAGLVLPGDPTFNPPPKV